MRPDRAGFRLRLLVVVALVAWVGTPVAATSADDAVWALLKGGGQVVMIRHAKTDGSTGDPPGFRLDDCTTQRNLVDQGREDAQRIGRTFAARGVPVAEVLSSRWCRCLETARLAFGRVEPWNPLMAGEGELLVLMPQGGSTFKVAGRILPGLLDD